MIRLILAALLCVVCSSASYAKHSLSSHPRHTTYSEAGHGRTSLQKAQTSTSCDAMRPCYGNGRLLYDSAQPVQHVSRHSRRVSRSERHAHRRVPEGLAKVMAEGAGRAAGLIRSTTGATAHVAARATGAFQCLVDRLDAQGYPIRFMGGWRRHGSVRASLHPAGLALDINQLSRNVTRPHMPGNEIALANSCGLISGRQWANGDSGHFQLGGYAGRGRHYASRHHRRHHYARAEP